MQQVSDHLALYVGSKTYLRATMKQERLNHLLFLQVHKEHTDGL